jgi:thioesterase domain-containing protein
LNEQGEEVATLALLDSRAPDPTGPVVTGEVRALAGEINHLGLFGPEGAGDPLDDALVLAEVAGEAGGVPLGGARRLLERLSRLEPDARRLELLRAFDLDGVYRFETGPERIGWLWDVLRANLLAGLRYRPRPYPGRVVLFRAADRPSGWRDDPAMGWNALATQGVRVHEVRGDHATILKPPGVLAIASALREALRSTEADPR